MIIHYKKSINPASNSSSRERRTETVTRRSTVGGASRARVEGQTFHGCSLLKGRCTSCRLPRRVYRHPPSLSRRASHTAPRWLPPLLPHSQKKGLANLLLTFPRGGGQAGTTTCLFVVLRQVDGSPLTVVSGYCRSPVTVVPAGQVDYLSLIVS